HRDRRCARGLQRVEDPDLQADPGLGPGGSARGLGSGTAALLHDQRDPAGGDLVGVRPVPGGSGLPLAELGSVTSRAAGLQRLPTGRPSPPPREDPRMPRAYYSTVIDQPASTVWQTIRDFGHYSWAGTGIEAQMEDGKSGDAVGGIRRIGSTGQ